jgi:hypothetical protein
MCQVLVARFKATGEAECGVFLVDISCLGVKDAFFTRISGPDYPRFLDRMFRGVPPVSMTPACARKFVEGAVEYTRRLGIPPHPDYRVAARVLGGIDSSECSETFMYGHEGKPLYVQGPNDSPAFITRVLRALKVSCGPGGYHYLVRADCGVDPNDFG